MNNICIYCLKPISASEGSKEHIISEALGCDQQLSHDRVHAICNSVLGHDVESAFINSLSFFTMSFGVRRKNGELPKTTFEVIEDEGLKGKTVKYGENGPQTPKRIFLGEELSSNGRKIKDFRIFDGNEGELEKLKEEMQKKYSDGIWELNKRGNTDIEIAKEDIFSFLKNDGSYRCIAKYAFNYLCWVRPDLIISEGVNPLREYILNGKWEKDYRPCFLVLPYHVRVPNHFIMLVADKKIMAVVVLFGLFFFYVVISDENKESEWVRAHEFDPLKRKMLDRDLSRYLGVIPKLAIENFLISSNQVISIAQHFAASCYNNYRPKYGPDIVPSRQNDKSN
ncbi:MAG: hypothetical protein HYS08_08620 [Chlamydiae bacterium]|nr:hypothetical protein [Chlamydiota bacterium]